MIDLAWKLFMQTGDIEMYLLCKSLEDSNRSREVDPSPDLETSDVSETIYSDFTKL